MKIIFTNFLNFSLIFDAVPVSQHFLDLKNNDSGVDGINYVNLLHQIVVGELDWIIVSQLLRRRRISLGYFHFYSFNFTCDSNKHIVHLQHSLLETRKLEKLAFNGLI